ncbi:hypothetical protein N8341_02500 [Flavobacteriaceae bacterium]|nr:hypothetical protein [Flavobacteriaceae bacterium]
MPGPVVGTGVVAKCVTPVSPPLAIVTVPDTSTFPVTPKSSPRVVAPVTSSDMSKAQIFHTTCFALSRNPAQSVILEKAKIAFNLGLKLSIDVYVFIPKWNIFK